MSKKGGELAGVGRRCLAGLVDAWILVFLDTILGWVSLKILIGADFYWWDAAQVDLLLTKIRLFLLPFLLFLLVVDAGYFTYLIGAQGQTLGDVTWGVRVVGVEGAPVGYGRALLRTVASLCVSLLPVGIGLVWAVWDRRKQAWHDKVAGTLVVRYRYDSRREF